MKPFATLSGIVIPMDRAHVDTDQIIPKQFLKSIRRTGFQDNLFDSWRYLDEGQPQQNLNERQINHEFVLNKARFQDGKILLARENFGCGSSREHAVWALEEYGIRCLIAPSFADIFHNNCFKNGVLPIVLEEHLVNYLFQKIDETAGFFLTVKLEEQIINLPDGETISFQVDSFGKHCLLHGLNDIDLTLDCAADIRAYESKRQRQAPWLFVDLQNNQAKIHES